MDQRQAAFLKANARMDGAKATLVQAIRSSTPEGLRATFHWLNEASERPAAILQQLVDGIERGERGALEAAQLLFQCTQIVHAEAIEDQARAELGLPAGSSA